MLKQYGLQANSIGGEDVCVCVCYCPSTCGTHAITTDAYKNPTNTVRLVLFTKWHYPPVMPSTRIVKCHESGSTMRIHSWVFVCVPGGAGV